MKTSYALILLAFLGLALLGCTDNSNPIVVPNDKVAAVNSLASLEIEGIKHSLTGSANTYNVLSWNEFFGNVILPGPKEKGGFYNVFTVNAIEHRDGSFSGNVVSQFQGKIPDDYVYEYVEFLGKVKMKVIQLLVDETGTKAKVVCEITSWDGPQLPWWFAMAFIDKGEGKSSSLRDEISGWWSSDQTSDRDMWLGQSPQEFIDWQWAIVEPFFPEMGATIQIDNGNIQVR
jgi:hypothetical protein